MVKQIRMYQSPCSGNQKKLATGALEAVISERMGLRISFPPAEWIWGTIECLLHRTITRTVVGEMTAIPLSALGNCGVADVITSPRFCHWRSMNPILMPPFLLNFTLTIFRIHSVTSEASTEGSTICRITSSSIVSATYAGLTMQ